MEDNKKINSQIIALVVIVIILILCLCGIILFIGWSGRDYKVDNNATSTISTTSNIINTTKNSNNEAYGAISVYLQNLVDTGKIESFQINEMNQVDDCLNGTKIFNANIEYKRVDDTFLLNENDIVEENIKSTTNFVINNETNEVDSINNVCS